MEIEEKFSLLGSKANETAIAWGPDRYDADPPFSPGEAWPEHAAVSKDIGPRPNEVYSTVRESLRLLGLDQENYGTAEWNPLSAFIKPGDTVVLKPNFVRDFRESSPDEGQCVITQGPILRAVADYAYLALKGSGRLIIADAPDSDADFDEIKKITKVDSLVDFYKSSVGFPLEVIDLRPQAARKIKGVIVDHVKLLGDPAGYVKVDLGRHSFFQEINELCYRMYGSEYDASELVSHHSGGRHEYLISKTVLLADCIICLPKLKTHKKVGLTANLKNLVGINGNKNWLPHHRTGTPAQGGDQFSENTLKTRTERLVLDHFRQWFPRLGKIRTVIAGPLKSAGTAVFGDTNKDTVRSGNWHGNDTTWRMAIDLNRILYYADTEGNLHDKPMRRFFSVMDGIIGGQGRGPLDPDPRPTGVVIAGMNPVAVDLTAARLMGFDYRKIPILNRTSDKHPLPLVNFDLSGVLAHSNKPKFDRPLAELKGRLLAFEPHFGWRGHIETEE